MGNAVKHVFTITVAETCRRTKRVWLKSSLFTVLIKLLIKGTQKASKLRIKVSYLFTQSLSAVLLHSKQNLPQLISYWMV